MPGAAASRRHLPLHTTTQAFSPSQSFVTKIVDGKDGWCWLQVLPCAGWRLRPPLTSHSASPPSWPPQAVTHVSRAAAGDCLSAGTSRHRRVPAGRAGGAGPHHTTTQGPSVSQLVVSCSGDLANSRMHPQP